jgi:hypothetical protein
MTSPRPVAPLIMQRISRGLGLLPGFTIFIKKAALPE